MDRPEQGDEGAASQSAVCIEEFTTGAGDAQGGADIAIAALFEVGLEEQALDLAAAGLLLGLDPVQRELEGVVGGQPGFQLGKLQGGAGGGCGLHVPTVLLP
jgi:hypothetical protein